jgi:hypothetical protein
MVHEGPRKTQCVLAPQPGALNSWEPTSPFLLCFVVVGPLLRLSALGYGTYPLCCVSMYVYNEGLLTSNTKNYFQSREWISSLDAHLVRSRCFFGPEYLINDVHDIRISGNVTPPH